MQNSNTNIIKNFAIMALLAATVFVSSWQYSISEDILSKSKKDKIQEDLPPNFPVITFPINNLEKADSSYIFLTSSAGQANYAIILDWEGKPYKWRATTPYPFNLKLQPNGLLSYSESIAGVPTQAISRVLDEDMNLVDTYQTGNGYTSFPSEFMILPNGHALMVAWDAQPVNMQEYSPKGDPNATVTGHVVQELDKDKKVVFQWRSYDHVEITETYENLSQSNFRYVHLNAIELDRDGNFLFSLRHPSQILKVDRNTGETIWRLGGRKNEFTFINEHEENAPFYFSYQHDIRRQENGNITFFDNGNQRAAPQYSRGLEYQLDEKAKTAELVWEYRHTPDIYAPNRGSVQILKNGNYLVGCGSSSTSEMLSAAEVTPEGEVAMSFYLPAGLETYRTFKFDLPACQPVARVMTTVFNTEDTYDFNNETNNTGIEIKFSALPTSTIEHLYTVTKYNCSPMNPAFEVLPEPLLLINRVMFDLSTEGEYGAEVKLNLNGYAKNLILINPKVYFRPTEGEGNFVELESTYNSTENTLTFNIASDGELCIGRVFDNRPPLKTTLIYPYDNAVLNKNVETKFQWSPVGRYTMNKVEFYKMVDGNMVEYLSFDTPETSFKLQVDEEDADKEFYWQVTSRNSFGEGETSPTYKFTLADSYMNILIPNGGEKVYKDDKVYLVKWADNLDDIVRIELLKNGEVVHKIADSLKSPLNIIRWSVPQSIPAGTDYKVRITNLKNLQMVSTSESDFEILEADGVENEPVISDKDVKIFPNPSAGIFNVSFDNKLGQDAVIKIHDLNGRELFAGEITLSDSNIGINLSGYNAGIYLLKIYLGNEVIVKKLVKY